MPRLGEIIDALEEWYPPAGAGSWDAVGLVCGVRDSPVDRILLAIDAVPAVIDEAESIGAQLLFTHHPLLLTAVHGVPAEDPKGGLVHRMIRGGIAHFVAHTNAEVATPGVSDALAARLGLSGIVPLEPRSNRPHDGVGRIGNLPADLTLAGFTDFVADRLPATSWGVRAAGRSEQVIRRVAVLGGSGSSLVDAARAAGADAYLTADLKHHNGVEAVTQRAGDSMALVDAAHWATERPFLDAVARRLTQRFGATVNTTASDLVTDPWILHRASLRERAGPGEAVDRHASATT